MKLKFTAQRLQVIFKLTRGDVVFHDVPQSAWFTPYVRGAAEAGIVNGYKDSSGNLTGMYGPSNRITVAEALKIAVESAGYDNELYGRLFQGNVDHWASSYVAVANAEHFTFIDADVRLDSPASRAEVASMFADAFRVVKPAVYDEARYTDVETSTEFATSIEALSRDAVVAGDTDAGGQAAGTFRPFDAINRAEVAKIAMEARAKYGAPGTGRAPEQSDETDAKIITYTDTGFSPTVLRIAKGESVEFVNQSSSGLWVASDSHPDHTDLPGFDSENSLAQGANYIYTFTRVGSWGFHNHLSPGFRGTIVVE